MAARRTDTALKGALGSALRAVAETLSSLPVPGMLIGGMAVIARGVPRLTRDVDATVAAGHLDVAALADGFAEHGLLGGVKDAVDFAASSQALLLRHVPSGVDVVAFRPQDQQDIERLLTLHGQNIDLARVRRIIDEFAHAMEEPERLAAFEAIVATVSGK